MDEKGARSAETVYFLISARLPKSGKNLLVHFLSGPPTIIIILRSRLFEEHCG